MTADVEICKTIVGTCLRARPFRLEDAGEMTTHPLESLDKAGVARHKRERDFDVRPSPSGR